MPGLVDRRVRAGEPAARVDGVPAEARYGRRAHEALWEDDGDDGTPREGAERPMDRAWARCDAGVCTHDVVVEAG